METLDYKEQMTYAEIQKMFKDLEDIVALIEHTNEILTFKIKTNRSIFASFVKTLLIANNQALGVIIKYHHILDEALGEYLKTSGSPRQS